MERWDVLKVLNWTKGYLADKGVENSRLEAEWMLCEVLSVDRVGLYLNFDKPLSESELTAFRSMVARRAKREPLQYILGTQEFMGLEFRVTPSVLIPRHDTEVLVNEAVQRAPKAGAILDIGTGSGCVAIALAKLLPQAKVSTVDVSPDAIEVARENAEKNGVVVEFCEGSLFSPVAGRRFDMVVSNPPYIRKDDLAALQPEVRDFEPVGALDGGADGLDFYRSIIEEASAHTADGGWLLFEVGAGQAQDVLELFGKGGFSLDSFTAADPAGIDRVVGARLGRTT